MRVLNGAQMREADRRTIEDLGIPASALMERAGSAVAARVAELFSPVDARRVAVLCGRGNNGGDGLVAAADLLARGARVTAYVVGALSGITGAALDALQRFQRRADPVEIVDLAAWRRHRDDVLAADVIVDAVTGTGFKPPLTGLALDIVEDINTNNPPIVAIDLPSGLSADSGSVVGDAIEATVTIALAAPKLPHVLSPAEAWVGRWEVADIGIPADVIAAVPGAHIEIVTQDDAKALLKPRRRESHKGQFGHVLVVGGSLGKTGAVYLAAMAALRSGAGLVTVATPKSCVPIVASLGAEFMTLSLPEDEAGQLADDALQPLVDFSADVLALGPGLGRSDGITTLVAELIQRSRAPLVIDADGLNAVAAYTGELKRQSGVDTILTPHPGEMARLVGRTTGEVQADRLAVAQICAAARQAHVVLKGRHTLTVSPEGHVAVNQTGNPGMATGGTGDVLTGMIAGWLGQMRDPMAACKLAVYLHGRAGDMAASAHGEVSMIASDLLNQIGPAVRELTEKTPGVISGNNSRQFLR